MAQFGRANLRATGAASRVVGVMDEDVPHLPTESALEGAGPVADGAGQLVRDLHTPHAARI